MYKLPRELQSLIYQMDPTYHNEHYRKYTHCLKQIRERIRVIVGPPLPSQSQISILIQYNTY